MGFSAKDILNVSPILDRFDAIESRLTAIEAMQGRLAQMYIAPVADTQLIDQKLTEIKKHVPAMIDALVAPQIAEMRKSVEGEAKQAVDAALEAFESGLEKKFGARIAAIEKAVIDQSSIITALSERAIESDANMQRLLSAVEKLFERSVERPQNGPFESQLKDAIKRQPETADAGFRPRLISEDEDTAPKHRRKLTLL